jgi:hypothetical protein
MTADPDLPALRRRAKILANVVDAARGWARARAGRDARALADAEARLLRAVRSLEELPGGRRRGSG